MREGVKLVFAEMKGHCRGGWNNLLHLWWLGEEQCSSIEAIELGVEERLCNGNDGEAAACRGCQISIAEDIEEIRSSFGRNGTVSNPVLNQGNGLDELLKYFVVHNCH